jgi:thioester reductase-like protein
MKNTSESPKETQPPDSIAVIGMSCRFPGAATLDEFWENLRNGIESISFFCEEEVRRAGVPPEILKRSDYVRAKAILDHIEEFDADFFRITAREAQLMDPQHRIFLECAWHALEDAGYNPWLYPGRIGVYASAGKNTYLLFNLLLQADWAHHDEVFQLLLGNEKDYLSTRVSYHCNLTGPSMTIQSACSSSLVAVHQACQSLLLGECDVALAGGVSVDTPARAGYLYQPGGILSPDGHCRPFDARAAGTVFGHGTGAVVMRRLTDAIHDGDYVHAVVRGSAVNNDGARRVGFTAPSVVGQAEVISEALTMGGICSDTVDYVEAHGTGTRIGDPIEIRALQQAFDAGTRKRQYCAVGSLKSNLGHMGAAAGIGGLIKTILALKNGAIPPTVHYREPNPLIDFAASPFYVNRDLCEWPANGHPRRAGVSSFGQGGTNVHVVLEQAPPSPIPKHSDTLQVLPISARSLTALDTLTRQILDTVLRSPFELASIARTLQVGRRTFALRRAVVCRNKTEAAKALRQQLAREAVELDDLTSEAHRMAASWVRGEEVDWSRLWPGNSGRRLPLPVYPFERQRHWIDPHNSPVASAVSAVGQNHACDIEDTVASTFAAILGTLSVDRDASFFDLGGHSLLESQVRGRLREATGVDLPQGVLWEYPAARQLAEYLRQCAASPSAAVEQRNNAEADIHLDPEVTAKGKRFERPDVPRNILLTGATGLLGSHLLVELLRRTQADVYCLVRAGSEADALGRIRRSLELYKLIDGDVPDRIIAVAGDLGQPSFGLLSSVAADLGATIDSIYHAGAQVNFVQPYAALRRINVQGTHEVLRFAAKGRLKTVHHVSSIAVFESETFASAAYVHEDDDLSTSTGFHNGYDLSKWAAERLIALARERGVWASIYRFGNLSGNSRTGIVLPEHILACLIKGCIQMGAAPAKNNIVNVMPVDSAVAALTHLSLRHEPAGRTYHVLNPAWTCIARLADLLNARGYAIESIGYDDWLRRLRAAPQDNAFKPFLALVEQAPMFTNRHYDATRAERELAGSGFACLPFEDRLLDIYLAYWSRTRFLPEPSLP